MAGRERWSSTSTRSAAKRCTSASEGRAVVLDTEFGLVDGCQRLRGMTGWLEDLLAAPTAADALMEKVTAACVEVLRDALRSLGDLVDAVVVYEDLAGQTRPMVSPELYRKRIKPFHATADRGDPRRRRQRRRSCTATERSRSCSRT